jgi:alpha-L-fucosidase
MWPLSSLKNRWQLAVSQMTQKSIQVPLPLFCYRIEGSTDNANWTTLADLTATTGSSQVQVSVFRAQACYVRVTVTGLPSGAWASVRSLEVYDRPFS